MNKPPKTTLRPYKYKPPSDPIEILHKDTHFLIINKPAGLLSVAGKPADHKDCLEVRIQAQHPNARIIHRLDMDTSGVMVLARTSHAHRHIGLQFENRQTRKSYRALVWGVPKESFGKIDLPLICDWPNRPLQKVDFEIGKPAQTNWEVIANHQEFSRMALNPKTGRSHQLRVHMNELGHPILGDRLYAHDQAYKAAGRMMLHAETLAFRHPDGGEHLEFTAKCPF